MTDVFIVKLLTVELPRSGFVQQPNGVRFAHALHYVTGTSPLGGPLCAIIIFRGEENETQ